MAFEHGLSQLTYGRVGKRLGIDDRTVVYYFPSKNDLVAEVLLAIAGSSKRRLLRRCGGGPVEKRRHFSFGDVHEAVGALTSRIEQLAIGDD